MKTFHVSLVGTFYKQIQKFQKELKLNSVTSDIAEKFSERIDQISKKIFTDKSLFETSYADDITIAKQAIFDKLQTYERERIESDAIILGSFEDLEKEIDLISIQFDLFSFHELEKKYHLLMQKWQNLSNKKAYNEKYISQFAKHAYQKINHLKFRLDFPVIEELSLFSYRNTFAKKLLGKKVILSSYQKKWIAFFSKQNIKSLKYYTALEIFYSSLLKLTTLAERIYTENGCKTADQIEKLSKTIQEKIKTLLWDMQNPDIENLLKCLKQNDSKAKKILANAIMQMVEQLIL